MRDPGILEGYRLVVFDADDTLRQTVVPGKPCPHGPGEWVLRPRVRETLRGLRWGEPDGPRLGLASNQDQVAYGLLSIEMARRLLRDLAFAITGSATDETALQLCPHASEDECACRKPEPRMILNIMAHYEVGPCETIFVGNAGVDRDAAARAGVTFMWAGDLFGAG